MQEIIKQVLQVLIRMNTTTRLGFLTSGVLVNN